jgi:hypothetical protein
VPNKLTSDVKTMILAALDQVGGISYLVAQADKTPTAFMTLLGKVLPMSVAGEGGGPLVIRWEREPQVKTEEPVG